MNIRENIIKCALEQVGQQEFPAGSNKIKYNEWYYEEEVLNVPWCATSVSYIYNYGGYPLPTIDTYNGFAYVPTIFFKAKKNGWITTEPKPADIVIYDFNLDGKWDHTGIFQEWIEKGKTFWALEGNTTPDGKTGSQSNGGEYCRKRRTVTKGTIFINIIDNVK